MTAVIKLELIPNGPVNLVEISRVPCVGEHISREEDGTSLPVRSVYHTPFEKAYDAVVRVSLL